MKFLIIFGCCTIILILYALWPHIIYKNIHFDYLFGEIIYNCETQGWVYDFSKYKDKKIVGMVLASAAKEKDIIDNTFVEMKLKFPTTDIETIKNVIKIPKFFYVKDGYIPQNRLTKKYGKYQGVLKTWNG